MQVFSITLLQRISFRVENPIGDLTEPSPDRRYSALRTLSQNHTL